MSAPRRRRRSVARWLLVLAWMAVIFALSSISGLQVSEDAEVDEPIRALAHLGAYTFMAGLVLYALSGLGRPTVREAALAFAIAVLYGLTDELHQALVPDRTGQLDDLVIDAIGAGIGVAVAWFVLSRWPGAREATRHR